MTDFRKYLLPVAFSGLLVAPWLNDRLQFLTFETPFENRQLSEQPKIKWDHLDAFPVPYERYYRDHFSFRAPLMELYHRYKFHLAGKSPHPEKTIKGRNGWYFIAGKALEVNQGHHQLTEEQLSELETEWAIRDSIFRELGVKKLLWVIVPTKHSVYQELLCNKHRLAENPSRTSQIIRRMNERIPGLVWSPLEDLIKAKDSVQVFRKYDNHWNDAGGCITSSGIVEKIKSVFPETPNINPSDFYWQDTVYVNAYHRFVLGIPDLAEISRYGNARVRKSARVNGIPFNMDDYPDTWPDGMLNYAQEDTSLPSILVIRDSFGDNLIKFLNESFSRSSYVFDKWKYGRNENVVRKMKPDVVVYVTAESTIDNITERNELPDP